MEKMPDQGLINDETIIKKDDGKSLKYWQLRSDFANYLKRDPEAFLLSEKYQENLENMLVMLLGREKIVPWGGQITGKYKTIFDKLLEDFKDPYKFLFKNKKKDLPLFRELPKEDSSAEAK
jgi:hypothetical protein